MQNYNNILIFVLFVNSIQYPIGVFMMNAGIYSMKESSSSSAHTLCAAFAFPAPNLLCAVNLFLFLPLKRASFVISL